MGANTSNKRLSVGYPSLSVSASRYILFTVSHNILSKVTIGVNAEDEEILSGAKGTKICQ